MDLKVGLNLLAFTKKELDLRPTRKCLGFLFMLVLLVRI